MRLIDADELKKKLKLWAFNNVTTTSPTFDFVTEFDIDECHTVYNIPDNATNGDVLISLYPNLKYTIQNGRVVTTIGVASSFDLDWWNAKYKAEMESSDADSD